MNRDAPSTPKQADHIDAYVGKQLRLRRKSMKMSQEKLADQLGITFQQVQKYERGANRIGASRLFSIARVFNVPVAYFFPGPDADTSMADGFAEADQAPFEGPAPADDPEMIEIVQALSEIRDASVRASLFEVIRFVSRSSKRGR